MQQLLIIEDDEINCMIYERILANNFIQIDFAYDGQQGINKFTEKSYDLILLDLGLPKINGLQVARLIKEQEDKKTLSLKTPIIVITADNSPGTKKLALDAGVNEYLTKPFNIVQIQRLVSTYLEKRLLILT